MALHAVHVDHGIHPSSRSWATSCQARCEGYGVPLIIQRLTLDRQPGVSLEAQARESRYAALAELLGPADLVVTAHHLDDQAETLLLALLRGSGLKGLAAMPAAAPLGQGTLLRPLLDWPRSQLAAYAAAFDLTWIEDPSNRDTEHDRNYLRLRVMPILAERWPACATTIARSARHCAEAQLLVDDRVAQERDRVVGTLNGTVSIAALTALDLPLANAVLRDWIHRRGFPTPDAAQLGRILKEVARARPDADPCLAWPGCELRRYRDDLVLLRPLPSPPGPQRLPWQTGTRTLPGPLGRLALRDRAGGGVDPERLAPGGFQVAFANRGLRCRPDPNAKHRSLKKLFQEAGIPRWLRGYIPAVFMGERLIAIAGLSSCDYPPFARREVELLWTGHPWPDLLPGGDTPT